MAQWLTVRKADNVIKGYTRSSKGTVPPDTLDRKYISVSDAQLESFFEAQKQSRQTRRSQEEITWDGNAAVLPTDSRVYLEIIPSKTELDADGIDTITLTINKLIANGNIDSTFTATRKLDIINRRIRLSFVGGTATKILRTRSSEPIEIQSNSNVRLKNDVTISPVVSGDIEL